MMLLPASLVHTKCVCVRVSVCVCARVSVQKLKRDKRPRQQQTQHTNIMDMHQKKVNKEEIHSTEIVAARV